MSRAHDSWEDGWGTDNANSTPHNQQYDSSQSSEHSEETRNKNIKIVKRLQSQGVPARLGEDGSILTGLSEEMFRKATQKPHQDVRAEYDVHYGTEESEPFVVQAPGGPIKIVRRRTHTEVNEEEFELDPNGNDVDRERLAYALGSVASTVWSPNSSPEYPVEYYPHPEGYDQHPYYQSPAGYNPVEEAPIGYYPYGQQQSPDPFVDQNYLQTPAQPEPETRSNTQTPREHSQDETQKLTPQSPADSPTEHISPARPRRKVQTNVDRLDKMLNESSSVVEGEVVEDDSEHDAKEGKGKLKKVAIRSMAGLAIAGAGYAGFHAGYENTTGEAPTKTSILYVIPGGIAGLLP